MDKDLRCPICRSKYIYFSRKQNLYCCERCNKTFDTPARAVTPPASFKSYIGQAPVTNDYDISLTSRRIDAFMAGSTALNYQRDIISTVTARANAEEPSVYLNLYHCQEGDSITQGETQQNEYNRRIKRSDVFILVIDNGELGDVTLSEIQEMQKQKRPEIARETRMAAFVREGDGDHEKNKRWQEFIENNRDIFDYYYEYEDILQLPSLAEELINNIRSDEKLGKLLTDCFRCTCNIFIAGADKRSDEFVYALGGRINRENNLMLEENEKESLIIRAVTAPPEAERDSGGIHTFIISEQTDDTDMIVKEIRSSFFKRADIDVNVYTGEAPREMKELAESIREKTGRKYYSFFFDSRKELVNNWLSTRINEIKSNYSKLAEARKHVREGNYFVALRELETAAKAGFDAAHFYLGVIYSDDLNKYYNPTKAERAWRIPAERGDVTAMLDLGVLLSDLKGREKDAENFLRAAFCKGSFKALKRLIRFYEREKRTDEAEEYLKKAAESGSPYAQAELGHFLLRHSRTDEAEKYLTAAADRGISAAHSDLGAILLSRGQTEDAKTHLRAAADSKLLSGMLRLSDLLIKASVTEEPAKYLKSSADMAKELLRTAADMGSPSGIAKYAELLVNSGSAMNAKVYLKKAAFDGYSSARTVLDELAEKLKGNTGEKPVISLEKRLVLCPDCGSEYVYFSIGRKKYICEECSLYFADNAPIEEKEETAVPAKTPPAPKREPPTLRSAPPPEEEKSEERTLSPAEEKDVPAAVEKSAPHVTEKTAKREPSGEEPDLSAAMELLRLHRFSEAELLLKEAAENGSAAAEKVLVKISPVLKKGQ